ncbi:MAG TPA: peptide chain release factor N(5)-glutamine methyltransferase [Victivallales bacterium]|nr:peptide chain release factor N(5)-glutamine methyltransferase [Victivallales bacterium]HPO90127.1 peptide chain release factor N(5)-glutamine methyltransferase [Victivallales bacterium]HRR06337.1 peptide chain release factor N(5)-glutamine methyltransferase [Victivallales bacterium]HRR28427.1 peptide chain release factor N(5)-glutamine methyltransferase [Victivallales bacterium]HRU00531.1 peptide chain release factor N(5)-glutamine methyltransferase [Victivallales bacterium]
MMITIYETINKIRRIFDGKITDSSNSIRYIISEVLALPIPQIDFLKDEIINEKDYQRIMICVKRRAKGEPLQYIFGKAYFRNLTLKVGKGVLIPRPETELMVDEIIKRLPFNGVFCDIGTGSGAIAFAVASERPDSKVFASDISLKALKYARINKRNLKIKNVYLRRASLFSAFKNKKFNVIASNLPYIKNSEIAKLPCEIRKYEPLKALKGGEDGLQIIRKFFFEAYRYSNKGTFVIAEVSPEQAVPLKHFLQEMDIYKNIVIIRDLSGKDRFVAAYI